MHAAAAKDLRATGKTKRTKADQVKPRMTESSLYLTEIGQQHLMGSQVDRQAVVMADADA